MRETTDILHSGRQKKGGQLQLTAKVDTLY